MKRILLGFLLGYALNSGLGAKAQDAPVVAAHEHNLTVKDFTDALSEFDVRHGDQQPFFKPAYGATAFDATPPTVWIFNTGTSRDRQCTVVHEFLHIYWRQRGYTPPEEFINSEETRQCLEIYGDGK